MSNDLAESKPEVIEPRPTESGWLRIIDRFIEKGNSIEQLGRLLDLQQQYERDQARKAFNVAFADFKAIAPAAIDRTGKVGFKTNSGPVEYTHVELHRAVQALVPALSQHGLSHSWEVDQADGGLITVTCRLEHVDGHSKAVTLRGMPDTSGSKNAIQAVGSAVYYLERYTFLAVLGIAQGEDDDGRPSTEIISKEEADLLLTLVKEKNVDLLRFLKWAQVESIVDVRKADFAKCLDILKRKKPNGQKHDPQFGPDIPQENA